VPPIAVARPAFASKAAIVGELSETVPTRLPVVSLTKFTHQGVVLAVPDDPVRSFTTKTGRRPLVGVRVSHPIAGSGES